MGSIGQNIRKLREARGMSQTDLAKVIGKTRSAVSQYENDANVPRMGVIEDIANYFHVSKSEILGEPAKTNLTPLEQELVDVMRSVTPEGQRQLMVFARGIAATYSKNNQVAKVG